MSRLVALFGMYWIILIVAFLLAYRRPESARGISRGVAFLYALLLALISLFMMFSFFILGQWLGVLGALLGVLLAVVCAYAVTKSANYKLASAIFVGVGLVIILASITNIVQLYNNAFITLIAIPPFAIAALFFMAFTRTKKSEAQLEQA